MADMNDYRCIGRVGNTKMAYLNDGTPCMELSVAVDQSYKKQDGSKVEKTFWCRVKAFGKQAEFIEKWCHKGKRVLVISQPEERSWQDQQGNKRSTIEFHVRAPGTGVTPIDWPEKDDQPQTQQQPQQSRGNQSSGRQASGGRGRQQYDDDLGPAFPSEASGMDDVPFALVLAQLAALVMAAMNGGWVA